MSLGCFVIVVNNGEDIGMIIVSFVFIWILNVNMK